MNRQFHPISQSRHNTKHWKRYTSYAFAASDAIVPLVGPELPKASMSMPIAFIEQAEQFLPVALMGVEQGHNLFVVPDGRWAGNYVPAFLRSYPFGLMKTEDGEFVLCFDEASGLIADGAHGEAFFNEDGTPAKAVAEILGFLQEVEKGRHYAQTTCEMLKRHGLIQPWPITLKTQTGGQQIAGLYRIDEVALNALSGDTLKELQQAGALAMVYCQLLSMQHLALLGKLAEVHAQSQTQAQAQAQAHITQEPELDLEFLNSGTISFAGLGN